MTKALSISNLKKIYANGVTALKGINLEVEQGDFFALLGPNGAGKSTTIGVLCSLVNKTSGKILVFGHDLDTEIENAKACIGVVPQEINFNGFEKVSQILINQAGYYGVPRNIATKRAKFYLQKMGLQKKYNHRGFDLSGGMKRRLMIARALMNEPKLLILDEPTAGVDIETRRDLWQFLREINKQGITIILTTHYLEEAEHLCKNIAIIHHGDIIAKSDMKSFINLLQIQTVILDLEKPIAPSFELPGFISRIIDPTTLEVEICKGRSLNDLFSLLNSHHITVISMRNKTGRLEELFVHLTHTEKGAV
jgi:ABC-2 type transport system ATP-binding protein